MGIRVRAALRAARVASVASVACLVAVVVLLAPGVAARAETLHFGILPVLDTLPLQVAATQGCFARRGLDVELVNFASALERDTAMQAGQIDGYFGDLIATLLLLDHGVDMRVALVSYRTQPGQRMFGLVTSPSRASGKLEDMHRATVGLSSSTIIEYLLDRMLERRGLPLDQFRRVEVKRVPIRMQMLAQGQIDLALLPEPLLSLAESQGGTVLATAEDLDQPLTVLCLASRYFRDGHTARAFVEAVAEAVRFLRAEPERFRPLMAEACRIPAPLVGAFPVYGYPDPALPSPAEVRAVEQWMTDHAMLSEPIPYARLVPPEAEAIYAPAPSASGPAASGPSASGPAASGPGASSPVAPAPPSAPVAP
ncbi:MAG: ABC transporter substrate-binding protein [Desulfovibrionaceae bacterium]